MHLLIANTELWTLVVSYYEFHRYIKGGAVKSERESSKVK